MSQASLPRHREVWELAQAHAANQNIGKQNHQIIRLTFLTIGRGQVVHCPPSGKAQPAEAQATHLSPCPETHICTLTHACTLQEALYSSETY